MLSKDFGTKFVIMCTFIYLNIIVIDTKHRLKKKEFGAKIVGGKSVALSRYPFAVQFFNLGALCGGVILNSWAIMTSAHCLESNKDIYEMTVQVGSKYIYDFNARKYEVRSFVAHQDYNKVIPFEKDIALVFVKEPIKFNKLAKKGILIDHNKWMDATQNHFVVTGWGWKKYGGALSELSLMMTYLTYIPVQECSRLHNLSLSEDMFCLYGDGERDTCRGDSGGGVLWRGRLVGLTSHGDGCAKKGKPSVYTNLWYMRNWIRRQMTKFVDNYCKSDSKSSRTSQITRMKRNNNTNNTI